MQNLNEHINNGGTVDYWQASIASAYDYSPFGVMLTGRTFEGKQTICEDSTTLITQKTLEEGFSSWGYWTTMGSALLTYVSGEMQVSNPNSSKKDIGASKAFTTGTGLHNVSFEVIGNTCATVVIWPPSSTPVPIKVYIRDNSYNIVASGSYTTAGTYNLSFTPTTSGANYKIEFYMTNASAFCFFRVDDVLVSYDDTTTVTVCKEVEDGYRYGVGSHEKIDEVSGSGNTVDMGDRWLDVRLGRTHKMDAHSGKYPAISPYSYVANNPLIFVDPDGKDIEPFGKIQHIKMYVNQLRKATDLDIRYDFLSGKLKYVGKPEGKIAEKIAGIIDNPNINIEMYVTDARQFLFEGMKVDLHLGSFLGNYKNEDGSYVAQQIMNPLSMDAAERLGVNKPGRGAAHETIEAAIGVERYPGYRSKPKRSGNKNQGSNDEYLDVHNYTSDEYAKALSPLYSDESLASENLRQYFTQEFVFGQPILTGKVNVYLDPKLADLKQIKAETKVYRAAKSYQKINERLNTK